MDQVIKAIKKMGDDIVDAIKKHSFDGELDVTIDTSALEEGIEVTLDTDKLESSLSRVADAADSLKETISKEKTDLGPLERGMIQLIDAVKDLPFKNLEKAIAALTKALGDKKLEVPKTFMLDKDQLRAITASMASAGPSFGGGETMLARGVVNSQVTMTDANTQYSYTFPKNTLAWRMKLRANNIAFLYSWATGKMPTSGDGSAYMSIPANFLDSRQGVDFSGKTIYFQAGTAGQVMEIEVYTAS